MPAYPPTPTSTGTSTKSRLTVVTSGNITWTNTSWAGLTGVADLTLPASVGDVVLATLSTSLFSVTGSRTACLDVASIVSAAAVNFWSAGGASDYGVQSWKGSAASVGGVGGGVPRALVSGDISGGNLVARLMCRIADGAGSASAHASSGEPLIFSIFNFGSA